MKRALLVSVVLLSLVLVSCASPPPAPGPGGEPTKPVEIEYWQYFYESKVNLVDELIAEFQEQNPNIKVTHTTFPYEQFNEKVAASIPAGRGPDVITLYYGWLPKYIDSGYLVPLPDGDFSPSVIESEFVPMVQAAKVDGKYYALPTAVRALAVFYNKDMWKAAGLDPAEPPKTLDELVDAAKKLTKRDASGKMTVAGWRIDLSNQDHHFFREVLVREFGGTPQSADYKKIQWTATPAGYDAWQFLTDLTLKHKVSEPTIGQDGPTAWLAQQAAMMISGSFYLGTATSNATFDWGVFPIPAGPKGQATFGSFWTHGITSKAAKDPDKLAASIKFLKFLTSAETMKKWTPAIGELPARSELIEDPELSSGNLKPFVESLPFAYATYFVDEAADRQAIIDAYDKVVLTGEDPKKALDEAVVAVQKIFDDYWSQK